MLINEIFQSIEGEGKRAGALATFIRTAGCNLRCSYCDTAYAFSLKSATNMSVEEILNKVNEISIGKYVTITGGEPLLQIVPELCELIRTLIQQGYEVNIETNGTIEPIMPSDPGHLFYTMDFKCFSSKESEKMNMDAYTKLTSNDVLKFVVGSDEDLEQAEFMLKQVPTTAQVYFSPVFSKIEAKEIVEYVQKHKLKDVKVQLQLHKYIWDPNQRGV